MTYDRRFATRWQLLLDAICTTMGLGPGRPPPIILSSLADLPYEQGQAARRAPLSFVQGPPGRNIALAIGLRAALPDTPLVLIMNADSVTLGTNHLIHAARRNIGMTLLLLRADVTAGAEAGSHDRMDWSAPYYQPGLESAPAPLAWLTALDAALVGRASLQDPDGLAQLIHTAIETRGFAVLGVTTEAHLELGILSRSAWPEYFDAYRAWTASFAAAPAAREPAPLPAPAARHVPRCALRIAGLGGHGIKLAGTILSEALGRYAGLWTTQRGEYGSATRGGPSQVDVIAGSDPIDYPGADRPDVLVLLSQGAARHYAGTQAPGAVVVADPGEVDPVPPGAASVPMTALARQHVGSPIAAGLVSLGAIAALTDLVSLDSLHRSAAAHVPRRLVDRNLRALEAGYIAAQPALEGAPHG
jgi:2-oxoglutarate ferredoxin oxidoreductase subunit gamma